MHSLWNEQEAEQYKDDLARRVYTSRLLGASQDLVLHGGGNTSVKIGEYLYVKGSGWDLASIEKEGFPAVKMDALIEMAERTELSDSEMVRLQREAMSDQSFPNPSIEAILHAIIPFKYVDHTHADAVVTLSNTPNGKALIRELYGARMIIIDYIMPGFLLAQKIYNETKGIDWSQIEGMILLNHGLFTFDDDGQKAYEKMINVVDQAEQALEQYRAKSRQSVTIDRQTLDRLSEIVSSKRGCKVEAKVVENPNALPYSQLENLERIIKKGPLTPEHVIRTKPFPAVIDEDLLGSIEQFEQHYSAYFQSHAKGEIMLDTAPRYGVLKDQGVVVFGKDKKELTVLEDIVSHTIDAVLAAETIESWQSITPKDVFDMEYWELEQAKLRKKVTIQHP
jgi:rhamnose utilization protein RhaD (predicted bifunctional aldolase and dehydrogenase)